MSPKVRSWICRPLAIASVLALTACVVLVLLLALWRLGFGPLNGRPMISSKVNTVLQVLYVLSVVAHAAYQVPPDSILEALKYLTAATILISGAAYASEFTRRALQVAGT